MPGVTISAVYGAGGQVIAHGLAQRLDLPVLDRAINTQIAERLKVSEQEAEGGEFRRLRIRGRPVGAARARLR